MSLKDVMLEQLAISRRIVTDGHENVPAWRIEPPDSAWLILTRFDPDKPGQSDRALHLVRRFMAWKFAQAFVMIAEAWLGATVTRTGDEAVTAVGASRRKAGETEGRRRVVDQGDRNKGRRRAPAPGRETALARYSVRALRSSYAGAILTELHTRP